MRHLNLSAWIAKLFDRPSIVLDAPGDPYPPRRRLLRRTDDPTIEPGTALLKHTNSKRRRRRVAAKTLIGRNE